MNYKKKQKENKEKANTATLFYDSGKKFSKSGQVRIKGVPYVNEKKRKLREEREQRKLKRKQMLKAKREEERWN